MPCNPAALAEGRSIIVCSRGPQLQRTCTYCTRTAPYLCDGPAKRGQGTCDAPICPKHATRTAPQTDLCPDHAAQRRAGG